MAAANGEAVAAAGVDPGTMLLACARAGDAAGVADILFSRRGAGLVNHVNANGTGALYMASLEGHATLAELLLSCGADVNLAKRNGATPLFAAAYKGRSDVMRVLLAAGADVSLRRNKATPLWIASMYVRASCGATVRTGCRVCTVPLVTAGGAHPPAVPHRCVGCRSSMQAPCNHRCPSMCTHIHAHGPLYRQVRPLRRM